MARFGKAFYIALGWVCVALGILGIILPVFPTTPFLLLAVWAFSRSSPATAARIRAHPWLGPPICNWEEHGVIPLIAKVLAVAMMVVSGAYFWLWSGMPVWLAALVSVIYVAVAAFILSKPSSIAPSRQ